MVKWVKLARIKKEGGWRIKNFYLFGEALAVKCLWRGIFSTGMWSDVIRSKDLKKFSVVECIRTGFKKSKGSSNIWNYLSHITHILYNWLVWKKGNGQCVKMEEDPFVAGIDYYKLS